MESIQPLNNSDLIEESTENRFPECLTLEVKAINLKKNNFDVCVTILFNEQSIKYKWSFFTFGIKGGELRIKIENGHIPFSQRKYVGRLPINFEVKRIVDSYLGIRKDDSDNQKKDLGFKLKEINAILSSSTTKNEQNEKTKRVQDEFSFNEYQISSKGGGTEPVWDFKCKYGAKIFQGALIEEIFGTVTVTGKPCNLDVKFFVPPQNLNITYSENFFGINLTDKKRSIINAWIRWKLLKTINSYISSATLRYE